MLSIGLCDQFGPSTQQQKYFKILKKIFFSQNYRELVVQLKPKKLQAIFFNKNNLKFFSNKIC
jgi:hypothetical protein